MRMPAEVRAIAMTRPQTVGQIVSNLYARRALGQQATSMGLDQDPATAAALRIARDKVLSDALLAKIDAESNPSDAAAEALARSLYTAKPERFMAPERVQARHILFAATDANAQAKAEKALEELKAGADFAAMAKERSADPGNAAKGGDLGTFARGRMAPEFETATFALDKPGQLSGVVKSQFGFHIIQLHSKLPAGTRPFSEVRDELVKEVRANLQQEARVAEAQKAQQGVQLDTAAIEALAARYAKPAAR